MENDTVHTISRTIIALAVLGFLAYLFHANENAENLFSHAGFLAFLGALLGGGSYAPLMKWLKNRE